MTVKTGVLEMNGDGEDRARDLSCDAGVNSGQGHQKMAPGGFELPLSDGIVRLYANLFAYTRTFSPILKISVFFPALWLSGAGTQWVGCPPSVETVFFYRHCRAKKG